MLAVAGCATMERFQQTMEGYIGWDIDQLREAFGYNYIERDIGEGRRAYTWTWIHHGSTPGYHAPDVIHTYTSKKGDTHVVITPGYYFPPEYYENLCEFSFVTDATRKAVSWRAHGNGCLAYQPSRIGPGKAIDLTNNNGRSGPATRE